MTKAAVVVDLILVVVVVWIDHRAGIECYYCVQSIRRTYCASPYNGPSPMGR
jgi:hypothetical protein